MIDPWMPTIAFVILSVFFVREWWHVTILRKSVALSEELVRMLSRWEVLRLRAELTRFLQREGAYLKDDPRIVKRLALFEQILQERRERLVRRRHSRALHAAGLPPLNETV